MPWVTEVSSEVAVELRAAIAAGVQVTNAGCHNWGGGVVEGPYASYGRIHFKDGGKRKVTGAHRASYLAHRGPIGPGLTVHHECYNTLCVNPDHLSLLTMGDNVRHGSPGRKPETPKFAMGDRTHCKNGHDWIAENVSWDKKGYARCKRCVCESVMRHYARYGRPSA